METNTESTAATITIDAELHQQLRVYAAAQPKTSMKDVVEAALRLYLPPVNKERVR